MKIFSDWVLSFSRPNWSSNPSFALIDSILEKNPRLILLLKKDIIEKEREITFGRKDTPSVEQIVRAAIFKEMHGLNYRDLEFAQADSRICALFIKLNEREPYSFQMFQKYISRIKAESLHRLLLEINKIAIEAGFEDLSKLRQDTTVVESNIHYPTNNSLVWDTIRVCCDILEKLKSEITDFYYTDYRKSAKSTYFKINVTKSPEKRIELFKKQLITFTKTINEVKEIIKKKAPTVSASVLLNRLEELMQIIPTVYQMTYRKEILGQLVAVDQKIVSIFEQHAAIICKGGREVQFGHKVSLATGSSSLLLDVRVLEGNPADKTLYKQTLDNVIENYKIVPKSSVCDGGYASLENMRYGVSQGIENVVFNKIVGSLQDIASSKNMATRLKKWRSGIEAVISNWKRGFKIRVCTWKGWEHFQAKVLWSALAYNFRVMTSILLDRMKNQLQAA